MIKSQLFSSVMNLWCLVFVFLFKEHVMFVSSWSFAAELLSSQKPDTQTVP